jgi:lysophospholipase L1-like esterase
MRQALRVFSILLFAGMVGACSRGGEIPEKWVGTWAAAPQAVMPGTLETFKDQQVRLIVHTSIGGSQVRIHLSNEYGDKPLAIGGARIARRLRDADIGAGEQPLSFAGKPTAVIAPGGTLASDAATFETPAFADLAVTLDLPGTAEATTNHFLALQTSYASAPGSVSATAFAAAKTIDIWPFLTAVDVVPRGDASAVVVFGDSTVDGDGSTSNANRRWPDYLARRLAGSDGKRQFGVLNLGVIGNRLLRDSPGAGSDFGDALGAAGIKRFERDALGQAGVGYVVLRLGVNDLGFPGSFTGAESSPTASELMAGYRQLAAAAHARDVRVIVTTLAPFAGTVAAPGYFSASKESLRQQLNAWLRAAPEFDGVIDADAALRDPGDASRLLALYDSGDHLHPGDASNEHLAATVPLAAFGTDR